MVGLGDGDLRGRALTGGWLRAAGVLAGADAGALWVWTARARAACAPVMVIAVALIAATIHRVTATTAVATPGLARILLHPRMVPARREPVKASAPAGRTGWL
jgi:hypothetical protein